MINDKLMQASSSGEQDTCLINTETMNIAYKGRYVEVNLNGDVDSEVATNMWAQVHSACKRFNCPNVLGITKTNMKKISRLDVATQGKLFDKLGFSHKHRIAWVENDGEAFDTAYNIETVLLNRGYRARLFSCVEEAKSWLLRR